MAINLVLKINKIVVWHAFDPAVFRIQKQAKRGAALTRPIAVSYSAPGVLAEAAHKTGRAKADFELKEISRKEYESLKEFL
jgi:hypothetical protein